MGRVDLVRCIDKGETTVVGLKSNDRPPPENVTETQLHIYALGYEELTGRRADFVEIYELDERKRKPRTVGVDFINDVEKDVASAAVALRQCALLSAPAAAKCKRCDYCGMCTAGNEAVAAIKG